MRILRVVVARTPALGKNRTQPEIGPGIGEELAGLLQQEEAAAIGDSHRIDGRRRNRGGDPDRRPGGCGASLGRGDAEAERPQDRAHEREGHAENAAMAQKGAAVDVTRDQLVDNMVLELAASTA